MEKEMAKKDLFDVWVYHVEHGSKIVKSDEAEELFKKGWVDSPAKFKKEKKAK